MNFFLWKCKTDGITIYLSFLHIKKALGLISIISNESMNKCTIILKMKLVIFVFYWVYILIEMQSSYIYKIFEFVSIKKI